MKKRRSPKPKPIILSPTWLSKWYELGCPAAWKYGQDWSPLEGQETRERGLAVHRLLSGQFEKRDVDDKIALRMYERLETLRRDRGLTILKDKRGKPLVEVWQTFPLPGFPGVYWRRCLDAVAMTLEEKIVIVDWKTHLGRGWKTLPTKDGTSLVAPQSLGFQSPGYTLSPPWEVWEKWGLPPEAWPTQMLYLVGPAFGEGQIFSYATEAKSVQNFFNAVRGMLAAFTLGTFPKVYGAHCLVCDFKKVCFEMPGWKAAYTARRREKRK